MVRKHQKGNKLHQRKLFLKLALLVHQDFLFWKMSKNVLFGGGAPFFNIFWTTGLNILMQSCQIFRCWKDEKKSQMRPKPLMLVGQKGSKLELNASGKFGGKTNRILLTRDFFFWKELTQKWGCCGRAGRGILIDYYKIYCWDCCELSEKRYVWSMGKFWTHLCLLSLCR